MALPKATIKIRPTACAPSRLGPLQLRMLQLRGPKHGTGL